MKKEKVTILSWKCKNYKIVEVLMHMTTNEEVIKRINIRNSVKPLVFYASASLSWKR